MTSTLRNFHSSKEQVHWPKNNTYFLLLTIGSHTTPEQFYRYNEKALYSEDASRIYEKWCKPNVRSLHNSTFGIYKLAKYLIYQQA